MKLSRNKCHKIITMTLMAVLSNPAAAFAQNYMMDGKPISDSEAKSAEAVKQALKLLDDGDVAKAVSKAEEAKSIAPNFYYTLAALGVCYARAGKSDEAIATFRETLNLKPDLPDTLWSLAATLQSAGRTDEAIPVFKEFVAKYPQDPKARQGESFLKVISRDGPNKVAKHSDTDYFEEAIGKRVLRWPNSDIPIKIFINKGSDITGYKPEYGDRLQQALKNWQDASQEKIKFEQVDSPDKARITFKWSANPADVSNPSEGGEALIRPFGTTIAAVKITVLTVSVAQGMKLTDKLIELVCTHELGHALGIAGHSPSPKDIMYSSLPLDYERLKISDRDAKTLQQLYAIDIAKVEHDSVNSQDMLSNSDLQNSDALVEITHQAMDAMNAKDYDKAVTILQAGLTKYPQSLAIKHNLASALNNTGLMAMNNRDMTKALDIFNRSLTLNPDSKNTKRNISVLHYNIGLADMKVAKFKEAEPELKLSVDSCESSENTSLLPKAATLYAAALKMNGKLDLCKQIETKYKVTAEN